MVSDASKKKAAQKKAAAAAKRGGKAASSKASAAAASESQNGADKLANGVGALEISDRTCTGVLCSHPLSRDIRVSMLCRLCLQLDFFYLILVFMNLFVGVCLKISYLCILRLKGYDFGD